MLTYLLFMMVAQTEMRMPQCWNCVTVTARDGMSAQATINIEVTIISSSLATVEMKEIGEGLYKLASAELVTGMPEAFSAQKEYVIFDDHDVLKEKNIELAFLQDSDSVVITSVPETVLAYAWPKGMSEEQVASLFNSDPAFAILVLDNPVE